MMKKSNTISPIIMYRGYLCAFYLSKIYRFRTQMMRRSNMVSPNKRGYLYFLLPFFFIQVQAVCKQDKTENGKIQQTIYVSEGTKIYGEKNISSEVIYIKKENKVVKKRPLKKRKNLSAKAQVKNSERKIIAEYKFVNTNTEKLFNVSHDHFSSATFNTYYSGKAVLKDFFIKWQNPLDYTNSTYQYFRYLKSISYQSIFFTRPPPGS